MHKIIDSALVLFIILWFVRRGRVARSIDKSGRRQVWGTASDARFPRFPKSRNPFSRKTGLK